MIENWRALYQLGFILPHLAMQLKQDIMLFGNQVAFE